MQPGRGFGGKGGNQPGVHTGPVGVGMGLVKTRGNKGRAVFGVPGAGKGVEPLRVPAQSDIVLERCGGQIDILDIDALRLKIPYHIQDGLRIAAAGVDRVADGHVGRNVAGSAGVAFRSVGPGQTYDGRADHRRHAALNGGKDIIDVQAVGEASLGEIIAVGVRETGGFGLFIVVAEADDQEHVAFRVAQGRDKRAAFKQRAVFGHSGEIPGGGAGVGQVVYGGVEIDGELFAPAFPGQIVFVAEGGGGGISDHPDRGLALSPGLSAGACPVFGTGGVREHQQPVHIDGTVLTASG